MKENYLMQWDQIKEQYKLLNLTSVENDENRKFLKKLDRKLLQLNASFITLSRETIMLTYDKDFILTMLQLRVKVVVL